MQKEALDDYKTYIRSDYWKARQDAYFTKFARECAICVTKSNVELHHMFYDGAWGQEADNDLVPLCRRDHQAFHYDFGGSAPDMREATRRFIDRERRHLIELELRMQTDHSRLTAGRVIELMAAPGHWLFRKVFRK